MNEQQATSASPLEQSGEYVTFTLADEEYVVQMGSVQEIISYRGFTKLPNVSEFVRGVLNLRGTVVPVIDLRVKFGMSSRDYDKYTVIIIVEVAERIMGVVVDEVTDVIELAASEVLPAPTMSTKVNEGFIRGMAEKNGKFLILLDIAMVLSTDELDAMHAAA